ncbi:PREDICTED: uncharacterized protein LOC104759795 [Camelina sativa]|uniref:ATP-dependent DNA helicase n=1 Tax=Camelina sativa TaxID=90675 RepID=A0ABM0X5E1_CAMSA|nr:PREDICTED: uncharacterized protein LOC104759795 [Camelina sativa]
MATCKYYGFPDLFITFTCNPRWPEIDHYLERHRLSKEDRPDICSRVFKMKLDRLMDQVRKEKTFGIINSAMYTIEFQKRGLPHAHMILFLHPDNKMRTSDDIDKYISAEIPDKEVDKCLYEVVSDVMIHGPCGPMNRDSVCMNNGQCTKFFPKPFMDNTFVDDAGYPIYRRQNDGRIVEKRGLQYNNSYVIPYNRDLSLRFRAHINVEWCNQTRSVKYSFKYITKGPDYVRAEVGEEDQENEIKKFFNCRYVSACEVSWRIFAFRICYHTTAVEKLLFHLPGQELAIYNQDDPIEDVLHRTTNRTSKFLGWMECNKIYPQAKKLTYAEFPSKFVWNKREKLLKPRSEKWKIFAIGRITYVPPYVGQAYYLRVLLNKISGPTSFDYLKTVNGVLYNDFQEACYALGLLDDDKEYIAAINEAGLMLSRTQIENICLTEIELMLRSNGTSLTAFERMPRPDDSIMNTGVNRLIADERITKPHKQLELYDELFPMLTDEQRRVYEEIIHSVNHNKGDAESDLADLIREAKLIIWDKGPMMNKLCYENLDRSLRDIMKCDQIFGGKVVVLGGDFRQILPVITEGGRVATVLASINSSVLWNSCKVLKLTENLRLRKACNSMDAGALATFSKWLLDIGDGKINESDSGDVEIEIPDDLLINTSGNPIEAIVKEIYGEQFTRRTDPKFFSERAILSPRNDDVDKINQFMLTKLPDVCGCVVAVTDNREHAGEVVFTLLNGRNESIKCRAVNNYATLFMYSWESSGCHLTYRNEPVFCVLRFWRVGEYEGKPCIENTLASSKIFIKPDFERLKHHKAISEFVGRYYINRIMEHEE